MFLVHLFSSVLRIGANSTICHLVERTDPSPR
jgi:hypothetical protein